MPKVTIYTKDNCPYCRLAKNVFDDRQIPVEEIRVDLDPDKLAEMITRTHRRTVPEIFIDDHFIGGYDDLAAITKSGKLDQLINS